MKLQILKQKLLLQKNKWRYNDPNRHEVDTAEFDEIGPLIDGKVITFKDIGDPYLETSIERSEIGIVKTSFCEKEIGYLNCKTGEKVSLCKVKPIAPLETYVYLDSTYAYVIYSKLPDRELPQYLNEKDYDKLLDESYCSLLRINVKTNEVREYNLTTTASTANMTDVYILGKDSLILRYSKDENKDRFSGSYDDYLSYNDYQFREYMDCINLSSGDLSNFYYHMTYSHY